MNTLKEVLHKDHSKKTKAEMIEMLVSIQKAISPAEYEKISGIEPSELSELQKKEILEIIKSFAQAYKEDWEKALVSVSADVMKGIFGMIAADEAFFRAADASDAGFAAELGSIDFATIIGGPLDACVTAQNNASLSTVSFIKAVGFDNDGKIKMVDFSYKKSVPDPENPGNTKLETVEINVPFISILNIPSLRIETCEVDFNVKLNSTFTKNTSSEFGLNAGVGGKIGPVKFKVDVSYKRTSSTGIKVEKEYSLGVKVKATNDEMPAGLEKVLGLLSQ
jgi:hypothetical protein